MCYNINLFNAKYFSSNVEKFFTEIKYKIYHNSNNNIEMKNSLESSLDPVLFAAELDFPKILVPRLTKNRSNVNTECARKSKQLYSLYGHLLEALIYLNFIILVLICF